MGYQGHQRGAGGGPDWTKKETGSERLQDWIIKLKLTGESRAAESWRHGGGWLPWHPRKHNPPLPQPGTGTGLALSSKILTAHILHIFRIVDSPSTKSYHPHLILLLLTPLSSYSLHTLLTLSISPAFRHILPKALISIPPGR